MVWRSAVGTVVLVVGSTAGCRKATPPAGDLSPPELPAAALTPAPSCPSEARLWLALHGFRPDESVADVCARLDRLGEDDLRSFDRLSPSRIGYQDVRAGLLAAVERHGRRVTVRDLRASRGECIGAMAATEPDDAGAPQN